jgi:ankyrin repeat protein
VKNATNEYRLCSRTMTAALLQAAKDGRNDTVLALLNDTTARVNAKDEIGLTALHFEATHGHNKVVQTLLNHKAAAPVS